MFARERGQWVPIRHDEEAHSSAGICGPAGLPAQKTLGVRRSPPCGGSLTDWGPHAARRFGRQARSRPSRTLSGGSALRRLLGMGDSGRMDDEPVPEVCLECGLLIDLAALDTVRVAET